MRNTLTASQMEVLVASLGLDDVKGLLTACEAIFDKRKQHPILVVRALEKFHPEDLAAHQDKWRRAIVAGEAFENEARLRRADGEYRWFLHRGVPFRDNAGHITKWYGTSTDIEDRKQVEQVWTEQARQAAVRADVSTAFSKSADLHEILRGCAEAIVRHVSAAFARIWTPTENGHTLELQASAGLYTHLDGPHSRIPVGQLKIGLIAAEKKPHLTNDVTNDPRVTDQVWARNEGMVAFAGYPLIVEERLVGVMAMFARERLSAATLDTLGSVADLIAQGIERKRAEEKLRHSETSLLEAQRLSHTGSWTPMSWSASPLPGGWSPPPIAGSPWWLRGASSPGLCALGLSRRLCPCSFDFRRYVAFCSRPYRRSASIIATAR